MLKRKVVGGGRPPQPFFLANFFYVALLLICGLPVSACATRAPDVSPSPASSTTSLPPNIPSPSLHLPDPLALLRVLNHGVGLERGAWEQYDYPSFHGDFLTSPEARALFDFVQADFDQYYPEGLPGAGAMFTTGKLDPNIWFPPRAVWMLAQAGIVERLRAESIILTEDQPLVLEPFTLLPTSLELDGDPAPEWLVEVTSEPYNLHGWFPLDDGYTLIPNEIQHNNLTRAQGTTLNVTPDLNGDGLNDLFVHFDGQPLGTQFGELKVYGRVEGRVILLAKIELGPGDTFDVTEHDGNGASELRVSIPRTYNFGCEWVETDLYNWRGNGFYDFQNENPPDTPLCNAAKYLSNDYVFTSEISQMVNLIIQNVTSQAPSEDYLALLYVNLALDYTGQLEDVRAGDLLAQLNQFQNSRFAALAHQKWEESGGSPLAFCSTLVEAFHAGEMDQTALAPYFSTAALFQAYGNRYESAAPLICTPDRLLNSRVVAEKIPLDENPVQYLGDKDYPLLGTTELNLDDDPELEWVTALSTRYPTILLFDPEPALWKITTPYGFSAPIQNLVIRAATLPDEESPALILLGTFAPSVPVSQYPACWEQGASTVSELSILQLKGNVPISLQTAILCGIHPEISALSTAEILALIPEPVPPVISPDDQQIFFFNLEQFENEIFSARNFKSAREGLQGLLNNVPVDHPTAPHLIPRILFGIGLSYEVEGEAETAQAAYLDMITQWPDSPWAWLAEARITDQ